MAVAVADGATARAVTRSESGDRAALGLAPGVADPIGRVGAGAVARTPATAVGGAVAVDALRTVAVGALAVGVSPVRPEPQATAPASSSVAARPPSARRSRPPRPVDRADPPAAAASSPSSAPASALGSITPSPLPPRPPAGAPPSYRGGRPRSTRPLGGGPGGQAREGAAVTRWTVRRSAATENGLRMIADAPKSRGWT